MLVDSEVRQALEGAVSRLRSELVPHTLLEDTRRSIHRELDCYDMVLLLGPSRVGKGALIRSITDKMNASVVDEPSKIPAAIVRARVPHRKAFSWRTFWIDALRALEDPLAHRKVNRASPASGVERGTGARYRSVHEPELADMFADAARDRDLNVLFVDEALALLKYERGRVLRDQLDVLRNLADETDFKFVLVSTPRIIEHLEPSEELESRLTAVRFPRYRRSTVEEFKVFRRVARTFMDKLPEGCRLKLTGEQLVVLHHGSIGCVGHLVHWFCRAIHDCMAHGDRKLEWKHFEASVERDQGIDNLWRKCLEGERQCEIALARTLGDDPAWASRREPDGNGLQVEFELSQSPGDVARPGSSTRIGIPKPSRPVVGR